MDIQNKYTFLIDTLNLVLLPKKTRDSSYEELVSNQLEELEGDHHTFLHSSNIDELINKGYLTSKSQSLIEKIRLEISSLDGSLWNPKEFIWNSKWLKIREDVLKIITEV